MCMAALPPNFSHRPPISRPVRVPSCPLAPRVLSRSSRGTPLLLMKLIRKGLPSTIGLTIPVSIRRDISTSSEKTRSNLINESIHLLSAKLVEPDRNSIRCPIRAALCNRQNFFDWRCLVFGCCVYPYQRMNNFRTLYPNIDLLVLAPLPETQVNIERRSRLE